MFSLDREILDRYVERGSQRTNGPSFIDLGCGTGRSSLPLLERGLTGVAFDLSQRMLEEVQSKVAGDAGELQPGIECVRGNLVELDCFADRSFDYAICMFSTLGMIRGSSAREQTLRHVARILKPGGLFVFQVHNYWVHLFDPDGPWWMFRNLVRATMKRDVEVGDRFFPYRGIPNMYLHSFSGRELRKLLVYHGLETVESIPLNATQSGALRWPWLWGYVRASGWILVSRKVSDD